jgi:hypothetical protein
VHPSLVAMQYVDWTSMWRILVIGILGGAGLTGIFSFGLVALHAAGMDRTTPTGERMRLDVWWVVVAVVCFGVVLAGVGYGIYSMLAK